MARPAHLNAMQPARTGRTRTAPPQMPDKFPFQGRYRAYTLFDLTGVVYLLVGFSALRAVLALGRGAESWQALLASYSSPLWIAFHAVALVSVCFVGVRFFRLFPTSQQPRIGPVKPPPMPVIYAMLYAVWAVVPFLFLMLAGGVILE